MDHKKSKGRQTKPLRRCHFTKPQIERLLQMHHTICEIEAHGKSDRPKMDRIKFINVLYTMFQLRDDFLMERVFKIFDTDSDSFISDEEWISGLSIVLKGSLEEKVDFVFKVYDQNTDGYLTRDEMYHYLKNCLYKQPKDEDPEEGVKDIVELVIKKMDYDHDGKISPSDYMEAIKDDYLLLEVLGPCLPSNECCSIFLKDL